MRIPIVSDGFGNLAKYSACANAVYNATLYVGTSDGQIYAIPEPATMLLLGSGLIGLAGFRKKLRNNG